MQADNAANEQDVPGAFGDSLQKSPVELIREAFVSVDTLRGYTHVVTDGCKPSDKRGANFAAHLDSIQNRLREAIEALS